MAENVEYDPHLTVSPQLTEVRTVLSRARTALREVESYDRMWVASPWTVGGAYLTPETVPHPEHAEMVLALRDVVATLRRWERTKRPRS